MATTIHYRTSHNSHFFQSEKLPKSSYRFRIFYLLEFGYLKFGFVEHTPFNSEKRLIWKFLDHIMDIAECLSPISIPNADPISTDPVLRIILSDFKKFGLDEIR